MRVNLLAIGIVSTGKGEISQFHARYFIFIVQVPAISHVQVVQLEHVFMTTQLVTSARAP